MKGPPSLGVVLGVVLTLIYINSVSAHVKLNVPRVRLPYFETLSVNFTLKVDTPGCYTWSISRTDLVTLTTSSSSSYNTEHNEQDGQQCSDSAVISTIPRVSSCCPASAIVFAEDVLTKETVRCDVIVDKISAIQILTTTKELHLEEAPSKFHIQGYGSKDNELSTLDGIPFTWVLESAKNKETSTMIDPQSIMRFIPFSESPYKATPGVAILEAKHSQGDTVLLEGIKTGSAEVIARVNDPSYKSMEARVRIIVVASLLLEPSEAWVVPGTVLPLTLWQIKHGKKFEVGLPSSVYVFSVENEKAASYNRASSTVTALDYGDAKISVKDKNWVDELEEHLDALTTKIHVTEPKYLSLSVYPYKHWALVMGNVYEVQVDIYNSENQKLYIGQNLFVETKFDPAYFKLNYSSPNGTYHIGVPIKLGSSYVTAELQKIVLPDGSETTPSPRPRVKTEMEIFQNIAINPKETVLPWDPNVMPKYELRWNPSGGNGNYIWTSSNTSVVTVSQSATGRTEGYGWANVTVSATVNSFMKNTARVYVLPPTRMEIVEHIVEAEIGTAIQVPLALYTIRPNDPNRTEVPYSSCSKLPIRVHVEDPNFVYDDKTHYPNLKPACVVLPIMGNALGSSKVTATYSVEDKYFESSVIVSTFKPLRTVEPENGMVVLAIGSTKQIVFEGGPRPLLEKHSGFQKTLTIENKTVASNRPIKLASGLKDDVYVYEVICKEIGETDAIFQIGNTKNSEQSQPIIRIKVVRVICSEPYQMYFKVESSQKSKCPVDGSSAQVVRVAVANYEPTLVSVIVKDKEGHKFDNITSLKMNWKSKPEYLDFATLTFAVTEPILTSLGYIDTGKGLQTILPSRVVGNVEVTARVIGYRKDVLSHFDLPYRKFAASTEDELLELEHTMDLTLVADVTVSPSATVSLFNHPSSKAILKVKDGSGYFELDTKGSNKINVTYNQTTKSIEIRPLVQGKSTIILRDLCVPSKRETVIEVDVTGIGKIDVLAEDKIPVDGHKLLTVSLHDHNGRLLPPEILPLVKLSLRPMPFDILEVTPVLSENDVNKKHTTARFQYKIVGRRVGVAEVVFSAENGNIVSEPKRIDVFPPLKLSPKIFTILPGNLVTATANGGPKDADIVFSSSPESKNIASIQAGDINTASIKALAIGRSVIYARAVDPQTKKVWSEDFVEVKVVALTSLKIVSPLTYLFENEKMPIWFKGFAGKTEIPSYLITTASPTLSSIEWIVSNYDYAEIIQVFNGIGATRVGRELRTQFHALKTGNITVQVRAYYQGTIVSQKFEMDIRQYPYASTDESDVSLGVSRFISTFTSVVNSAYYWLFLPAIFTLLVLILTIAYNSFVHGEAKAKVDTQLFITSPVFSSTPLKYSPTSSSNYSPSAYSPTTTRLGGEPLSPNRRRLYSCVDSGVSTGGER